MIQSIVDQSTSIFKQYIDYINVLSNNEPMVTAALLAISSGFLYFLLNLLQTSLKLLKKTIKRRFVTSITINTNDWYEKKAYDKINGYLETNSSDWGSRTYSLITHWSDAHQRNILSLRLGYGIHIVRIEGKFFMASIVERTESTHAYNTLTLSYFGMSKKPIEKILDTLKEKEGGDTVSIYEFNSKEWNVTQKLNTHGLDKLALNDDTRKEIVTMMENFINSKDTCKRLGIAHKLTVILHGLPGTGKTSLIRAIAKEYGFNIAILNASIYEFEAAMSSMPKNCLICLEDFDSMAATAKRAKVSKTKDVAKQVNKNEIIHSDDLKESTEDEQTIEMSSQARELAELLEDSSRGVAGLSTFLNKLDGIVPLDGTPMFLTTNDIGSIDNAITREGRTDFLIELPLLEGITVEKHLVELYPQLETEYVGYKYPTLPGCILYDVKKKALEDHHLVIKYLDDFKQDSQEEVKLKIA